MIPELLVESRQAFECVDRVGVTALVSPKGGGQVRQPGDEPVGTSAVAEAMESPRKGRAGCREVVGYPVGVAELGPCEGAKVCESRATIATNREPAEPADGKLG